MIVRLGGLIVRKGGEEFRPEVAGGESVGARRPRCRGLNLSH